VRSPDRSVSQLVATPLSNGISNDVLTSPKSDAGVRYSSYPSSFSAEKEPSPRISQSHKSASSTMQQHSSTMNGMYSTPKLLASTRKTRSPASGGSRDREAALRQKARMRRRMQQEKSGPSGNDGSPEEGRPPRSTEKGSTEKGGMSPRSCVRKQRRDEQRRSRAQQDQV